jgi:hypothetical protein
MYTWHAHERPVAARLQGRATMERRGRGTKTTSGLVTSGLFVCICMHAT